MAALAAAIIDVSLHTSTMFDFFALFRADWSASCCGRFTPADGIPGVHWLDCSAGLQSRSGRRGKENNVALPGIELGPSL
jgi:hypothetical protein